MPVLYVENVPEELYEALRAQAKKQRTSIAAFVISLLRLHVPTKAELRRRQAAFAKLDRIRSMKPAGPGPFASTEEMIREDRER